MGYQKQNLTLEIAGLYTSANSFTGVPKGALDVADDVVIDHKNLVESRRGFEYVSGTFGISSDRCNQITNYQGVRILHYGTTGLAYYNSGWTDYSGSYTAPDASVGARVRFNQAKKNLYFSTSTGIKKLDVYTATPAAAGVPKGLDMQAALNGTSGFLTANVILSTTGTTTNTSTSLSKLVSIEGIEVGQYIYGTGITPGTTVFSITPSLLSRVTTSTAIAGNSDISAIPTSTSGIALGYLCVVYDANGNVITQDDSRVTAISAGPPYTITLSHAPVAAGSTLETRFYNDPTVIMSAAASASATVAIDFSDGAEVAYRALFGIRDTNNNVLYGAPSQYLSITNTKGTSCNVDVTATLPSGLSTSYFWQLYRSNQTADASIIPSDDMQLVYEAALSGADISNGYVTVTDSIPDSLRGASLYTSVGQEGIAQSNYQPPYCKDFCFFRNMGIYGNVKSKQRKKLTILAVGGSSGIANNNTLTIAAVVYTAKTWSVSTDPDPTDTALGYFAAVTYGTPAQNITDTTNSLIKVINRYSSNTFVYASLISGPTDLPGQILLEERAIGGASFAITASAHGSAYSPTLPTSGTTVSSAQDVYKNGILVSKLDQPEAVPEVNLFFVGDAVKEILRVIPLREYVLVLKEDGIFRLTGTTVSTISVAPFDLTTNLLAPNSAVPLGNEVWGLFDQGICSVSDTGVALRSFPIDATIRELIGTALSTLKTVSFGVGYETDRRFILGIPSASGDTSCDQQYCFNTITSTWTRWTRDATTGFVDPSNDNLYVGNGASNTISGERKNASFSDFADESFSVTISSSSDYDITLASSTGIIVGDVITQGSNPYSLITAISGNVITVNNLVSWSAASATIYPSIDNVVQWKPIVADNPSFVRQYSEGQALFKQVRFHEATLSCFTDMSQGFSATTITGFSSGTWGSFPWGSEPWGGNYNPRGIRFLVPQNKQIAAQITVKLTVNSAYSDWQSEGIRLSFNDVSQETI